MDRPEEIQKKIDELQELLKQSKAYHEYAPLENIQVDESDIGFFDLERAEKILKLLHLGFTLQFRHLYYGAVNVKMNPQRNRILVTENTDIKEENIMNYIVRHDDWFVKTGEL